MNRSSSASEAGNALPLPRGRFHEKRSGPASVEEFFIRHTAPMQAAGFAIAEGEGAVGEGVEVFPLERDKQGRSSVLVSAVAMMDLRLDLAFLGWVESELSKCSATFAGLRWLT